MALRHRVLLLTARQAVVRGGGPAAAAGRHPLQPRVSERLVGARPRAGVAAQQRRHKRTCADAEAVPRRA
eukprot:312141-Chlamydomonas_euryale.AAC.2